MEIRPIGQVEDLRSQLDIERIRKALDAAVLDQGRIEIDQARSGENVAADITAQIDAGWVSETRIAVLRIERLGGSGWQ